MAKKPKSTTSRHPDWRLIAALSVPIAVVRTRDGHIEFANTAFEELSGYTIRQLKNLSLPTLFSSASVPKVGAILDIIRDEKDDMQIQEIGLDLIRKSRRKLPVNLSAFVWRVAKKDFACFSLHDISQIQALNSQREKTISELSQISKLADIGLLAAGVAHELNNPLMIVQGFTENLDMAVQSGDMNPEEFRMQIAEILKACERMSRIIFQMARIVRSEDVRWELIDLQEISQEVLRFVQHEIRHSEISVTTQFAPQALAKCDHNKIEQVLLNILSNAVHALNLRPSDRKIYLSSQVSGKFVELRVWNNGPSIPQNIQDKVMSPFFTTKDVGQGTGLGLSVSYGIMRAHGGDLTFTSDEKSGTCFILRFPRPAESTLPPPIRQSQSRAVLLIDDEAPALAVLASRFEHFGYTVIKVMRAKEAFQILQSRQDIVAVFSDLRMPEMDGLTFLRQVQSLLGPGVLLFAVTGYALSPQGAKELTDLGVQEILKKPINQTAFAQIISQIQLGRQNQAA